MRRFSSRQSRWRSRWLNRWQPSLTSQVTVTGEPSGTTELDARTHAHGPAAPSEEEESILRLLDNIPDLYLNSPVFHLWRISVAGEVRQGCVLSQLPQPPLRYFHLDLSICHWEPTLTTSGSARKCHQHDNHRQPHGYHRDKTCQKNKPKWNILFLNYKISQPGQNTRPG